jgi:hypothetical protein
VATAAVDGWRDRKPGARGRILAESAETGKPTWQARLEIRSAANYFDFYAGLANLPTGKPFDVGLSNELAGVTREGHHGRNDALVGSVARVIHTAAGIDVAQAGPREGLSELMRLGH